MFTGPDASEAGIDGSGAGCSRGSTQCSGNGVETCAANGQWGRAMPCVDHACVGGVCTGVCTPGTQRCSGTSIETCGANGQWGTPWLCSTGTCSGGACTGSTTTATSCAAGDAGITNCGASQESCCTSLEVSEGTYYREYTNYYGGVPMAEADPATVSGFRLDKYLVTVGRFRQFVAAWNGGEGYTPPAGSGKHTHLNGGLGLANSGSSGTYEPGWLASDDTNIAPTNANLACDPSYATWTTSAGSQENLPLNCVNWFEAYAFCIWDGGFLSSEAEWEYTAAGGNQQREYPWGNTANSATDPGTNNEYAIYDCNYPSGPGPLGIGNCSGLQSIASVGTATLGAGRWGQLDLAGDVFEWNLDWWANYVDPCADCAYLTAASYRVIRGNSFATSVCENPWSRGYIPASRFDGYVGFRCARTP